MGICRSIQVFTDCVVSIQSERRRFAPYGLFGGEERQRGRNVLVEGDQEIELPSKATMQVKKGNILKIQTPGGGGYDTE
ncbi:MAG: hydantoinase B/oxoprolinase family protein [Theionarchaea archaeon]|nr:hydantoinase B/oxoprolinase family protein [Theionarchaea archaeon]MBU6999614.1 hydantoinase B/oxoprolinase family protein [Theionarchaea archaeon]MBU7020382.1 hydantoinase B/oxoprolinase family protein [Theionarchaea archaeon]MBU7035330.1 hydantoinase B/oxoprolinase family protein [Theionarchaea archaeon]MBU7041845.1 hydantoinase B/oxoprolinase family protein [Theionarchaea archaeon]